MSEESILPADYAYPNITTEEAEELEEETNKHWTTYITKVLLVIKTVVILLILIQTFVAWFRLKDDIKAQA